LMPFHPPRESQQKELDQTLAWFDRLGVYKKGSIYERELSLRDL
jgi:hypothetical protein